MRSSEAGASAADGDAVDRIATAGHPPGEHAGKALVVETRYLAIQGQDTVLDRELDRAMRRGRRVHHLDPVAEARPGEGRAW
jgi:hypothetical protein